MRWLAALLILPGLVPIHAQENEAEKLYRSFEKKLTGAKAFRVTFDTHTVEGVPIQPLGDLTVAKGDRFQLVSGVTAISDGKKVARGTRVNGKTKVFISEAPEKSTSRLTSSLMRTGLGIPGDDLFFKSLVPLQIFDPTGFKVGEKEKFNGVDTQIVEYIVPTERTKKGSISCKMWIAVKTGLPMKRTVEYSQDDGKLGRFVQTYTNWQIDPALDENAFSLEECENRYEQWLRKRGQN